jgi:CBS domain-containing protein
MQLLAGFLMACLEALGRSLFGVERLMPGPERVADHMSRNPATIAPDATLQDAAMHMWERDVGSLVVTDGVGGRRVLGMITDRDICMAAQLRGLRLSELLVREAMASPAVLCRETDRLGVAHARMREHQVRRLPVVDASGRLSGVIALADLARSAVNAPPGVREKRAAEVAATLAAVCGGRQ